MESLITPDVLRQLDAFSLMTRRSVLGLRQGAHRSIRRGHGVEFAEYRQYELGDNPRYIDWNLYGRSDKLYIKRYLEEETVSLFIVIDGSPSITHPTLRSKWEFAATLSNYISYIALASQDPVTISVLGHSSSAQFWGGRAFRAIGRYLSTVEGSFDSALQGSNASPTIVSLARRAASPMNFPGICVLLSDFLYPISEVAGVLAAFRARNMEVHAVQVLGATDIEPGPGTEGATLVDSETSESLPIALDPESRQIYAASLNAHNRQVREHCLANQTQFTSSVVTNPIHQSCIDTLNSMALFV